MAKSKDGLLFREGQLVYFNSCLEKYSAGECRYSSVNNQPEISSAMQEHADVVDRYFDRVPEEMAEW